MPFYKLLFYITAAGFSCTILPTPLDDILTKLANNMHTIANAKDNLNKTQGFRIALYDATSQIEELFKTNTINPDDETKAFFQVAIYGDQKLLNLFLKHGFKSNACLDNKTLLKQAALFYNVDVVNALVKQKAPFSTKSNIAMFEKTFLGALSEPFTLNDRKSTLAHARYGENPHRQCHKIITKYIAS